MTRILCDLCLIRTDHHDTFEINQRLPDFALDSSENMVHADPPL